jgi:SAM-dependent methyltransferase
MPRYARGGVAARVGNATDLEFITDGSVDFAFASNLFEHLTQAEFAIVLSQLQAKLKPDGTLNILQPNYRHATKEYFDDYTHISVYSDISLCDFLRANGYRIIKCLPRFLPLTIKSRLPVMPWLIRLYLRSPWKPMAKQMLIRAMRD